MRCIRGEDNILRIRVLTLVIRLISLLLMLASLELPNPGSATLLDHPTVVFAVSDAGSRKGFKGYWGERRVAESQGTGGIPRARKRSSDRIAMAFTRRMQMYIKFPNAKNIISGCVGGFRDVREAVVEVVLWPDLRREAPLDGQVDSARTRRGYLDVRTCCVSMVFKSFSCWFDFLDLFPRDHLLFLFSFPYIAAI